MQNRVRVREGEKESNCFVSRVINPIENYWKPEGKSSVRAYIFSIILYLLFVNPS